MSTVANNMSAPPQERVLLDFLADYVTEHSRLAPSESSQAWLY